LVIFGALGGSLVALLTAILIERRYHAPEATSLDEDWMNADGTARRKSHADLAPDLMDDPSASLIIGFWTGSIIAILAMATIAVVVVFAWGLLVF
jgi:hypothetical protein